MAEEQTIQIPSNVSVSLQEDGEWLLNFNIANVAAFAMKIDHGCGISLAQNIAKLAQEHSKE